MRNFKDFVSDSDENSPYSDFIEPSSQTLFLNPDEYFDDDGSMDELNEVSVRNLSAAAAIAYLVKQNQNAKTIEGQLRQSSDLDDKIDLYGKLLLLQSRSNLALGAMVYTMSKKR